MLNRFDFILVGGGAAGLTAAGCLLGGWFVAADAKERWLPLPPELAWPPQNPYLIIKPAFALILFLFGSAVISTVYVIVRPQKTGRFDAIDPSIFPIPPSEKNNIENMGQLEMNKQETVKDQAKKKANMQR